MDLESKILSREISQILYKRGTFIGTAESCTGGKIADAIVTTPGASTYFKGGIVSYVDEIKERLLGVDSQLLEEKTAVCEEVAVQMVKGACRALHADVAVSSTGIAGPEGGSKENPVGTIWIACGTEDEVVTLKLTKDEGRNKNICMATYHALHLLLTFLKERLPNTELAEENT
ncbi:MAG: CinA family protein [Prevotellaceae bacterium]|nr:CinA family protein [Prevotella sp.]MDD7258158.1 CinA family protein [Prevotellaceae bacterium]MDY6131001.1 CinA family protein [Prevotella sp.]